MSGGNDEDDLVTAGVDRLLKGIACGSPLPDGKQFFRDCPCDGQPSCSASGDGNDGDFWGMRIHLQVPRV